MAQMQAINLRDYTPDAVNERAAQANRHGGARITAFTEAIAELKSALDGGQIEVADYVKTGRELANMANASYSSLAQLGSRQATEANASGVFDKLRGLGFAVNPQAAEGSPDRFKVNLGQEYETRLREELLPKDLSPEDRERFLKDIPNDIGFDTDRFKIEREGVKQQIEKERALVKQKDIQSNRLKDLSTLLAEQSDRQFKHDAPDIAGEAQNAGYLETSGLGEALARRKQQLAERSQDIISAQGIADRDFEVGSITEALAGRQSFGTAGLERTFSTEDRAKQFSEALMIAKMSQPAGPKGKSTGEKWAQGLQIAASGAGAYFGAK